LLNKVIHCLIKFFDGILKIVTNKNESYYPILKKCLSESIHIYGNTTRWLFVF